MKQRHQPLLTRYRYVHQTRSATTSYSCTCGVFCGKELNDWRSHALDQSVLNPGIATFETKVITPELYALQRTMRQVGKSFGHIREVYGRAFKQIKEPFRHLTETADLMESGRRLASERDDLIASGVDPADLVVPLSPLTNSPLSWDPSSGDLRCPHRRLMVETFRGQKVTRCLDCRSEFPGEYTPHG